MRLSIVIVTHNRPQLLLQCLHSLDLSLARSPFFNAQVLVIVNGEDQDSLSQLQRLSPTFSLKIKWKKIPRATPAAARNFALDLPLEEWVLFLDDDSSLPLNYFLRAQEILEKYPQMTVMGGPDQTPEDSTFFARALGEVLKSPLATASTRFRHSSGRGHVWADEKHFILCNLWMKSSAFREHRLRFDQRLFRNEENILLFELQKFSNHFLWAPELWAYHDRKKNMKALIRPIFLSGFYRMKSFLYYPRSFNWPYLMPTFFLIYLMALPFLPLWPFWVGLFTYTLLLIYYSAVIARKKGLALLPLTMVLHLCINLSYGLGPICALMDHLFDWPKRKVLSYNWPR